MYPHTHTHAHARFPFKLLKRESFTCSGDAKSPHSHASLVCKCSGLQMQLQSDGALNKMSLFSMETLTLIHERLMCYKMTEPCSLLIKCSTTTLQVILMHNLNILILRLFFFNKFVLTVQTTLYLTMTEKPREPIHIRRN